MQPNSIPLMQSLCDDGFIVLLETSGAPLLLLMNRKKFESLPPSAQDLIRKYSGEWMAQHFIVGYDSVERAIMEQLRSDPNRKVVIPSSQDLETARAVFRSVLDEWTAISPRNRELMKAAQSELTKLRATR